MNNTNARLPLLIGIGSCLATLTLLLGLVLTHLPGLSPGLFALDLQTAMGMRKPTCATVLQPTAALCNNQDPVTQGCTADAHTTLSADIIANGTIIGKLERRHSPRCDTYWGRVFDFRPQRRPVTISIESPGIGSFTWDGSEAYSNMVFVPAFQDLVPAMDGFLSVPYQNGPLPKQKPFFTAHLPVALSAGEP
jgi:hypothetical protein